MSGKHFTLIERCQLDVYIKEGQRFQYEIAELLGKDPSAISRELKRNPHTQFGYDGEIANWKAKQRQKNSSRNSGRIDNDIELKQQICETLQGDGKRKSLVKSSVMKPSTSGFTANTQK